MSRELYKSTLFMQNKPNVKDAQINVKSLATMNYKKTKLALSEVEWANSNPNKPNCRKGKIDAKCVFTKDYRNKDDFLVRINKPNFRNCQNERKLTYNKGLQKKRLFSSPKNKPCPERSRMGQFKPKQTQYKPCPAYFLPNLS